MSRYWIVQVKDATDGWELMAHRLYGKETLFQCPVFVARKTAREWQKEWLARRPESDKRPTRIRCVDLCRIRP